LAQRAADLKREHVAMGADQPPDEEEEDDSISFIKRHDTSALLRGLEAANIILASKSGAFDAADKARAAHWERFLLRVASLMPNEKLKVGEVLSNDDLEEIYQRTANEGDMLLH
jgi:hypothetical protein